MDHAGHFDRVAAAYAAGRPDYPAQVFDLLVEYGVFVPGSQLLEIGAGSGQATCQLLDRGAVVDAVEPGPALAAQLRERFASRPLTVLEADAETVPLSPGAYDGVVAATSFHWVDRDVVLPRLHTALRPGARLVAWWTVFGDPRADTPFRRRVAEIARIHGLDGPRRNHALDLDLWRSRLSTGGFFRPERADLIRWTIDLTPGQLRDLFATFPSWPAEAVAEIGRAASVEGEAVTEHYVTAIQVAARA
ncbi:MAG: class I SAM-dependent methyltransferase [Nocardioides sp.]